MDAIVSRLDITQLFCDVDDFCQTYEHQQDQHPHLPSMCGEHLSRSGMYLSQVMTIMVAFHASGSRTLKDFYTLQVMPYWSQAFPTLLSYNRFVELIPQCLMPLCCFLMTRRGQVTGISFIDSTPISVCHPCRAHAHKVFGDLPGWGKNSMGWHYGFKLHLIINEHGELLAFKLTPANVDDRKPVPDLIKDLWGKLFGDRGYLSQPLFDHLYQRGVQLITRCKKKMKQRLIPLMDKILLRKRALIESVNDQLKNISQIEHSRHRSVWNFMVNLLAGLVAYTYQPKKPALDIRSKDLAALSGAIV